MTALGLLAVAAGLWLLRRWARHDVLTARPVPPWFD